MKIAVLSYPMLFQATGGLQIQVRETISALERRGLTARLIDPARERLADFDLVHVFSAINGNHRIVECANAHGVPVVVSPLIRPHWTSGLGRLARRLEDVVGKLTRWNVKTEYRHIAACLEGASALIALGEGERQSITSAFRIPPHRVRVIPNGIPERFFAATPDRFCGRFELDAGFVLNVASVNSHKNQLALARALATTGKQVVIVGPCLPSDRAYLDALTAFPHVRYLGPLDYADPLLASAFAAAGVFCLPAKSEVMPLSVMESLAAGTPVVMTRHHGMDLGATAEAIAEVEPTDEAAIRRAVFGLLEFPPPGEHCRSLVSGYTWDAVAQALEQCYRGLAARRCDAVAAEQD